MYRIIHVDDLHTFRVGSVQEYRDKLAGVPTPPARPVVARSMSEALGREPLPTLRERLCPAK